MPLNTSQIDIEERRQAGRDAATADGATEVKPFGQTSESNYPYTYWWIVGYNETVQA